MKIELRHLQISKPAKSLVSRTGIFANGFLDFSFFCGSAGLANIGPGNPQAADWGNLPGQGTMHAL